MPDAGPETSRDIFFQVPYVLRLRFAVDVLSRDQHLLLDLLEPSGDSPPRVQFWLDEIAPVSPENDRPLKLKDLPRA